MKSTYDRLKERRLEILDLAVRSGLSNIRVFGSVARGEENEDSDIDLLVNVEKTNDPFAFIDFQNDLSKMFSRKVDIVFESGLYHALREHVLNEAKPV
jgi:predicted nucleotidyltransferase